MSGNDSDDADDTTRTTTETTEQATDTNADDGASHDTRPGDPRMTGSRERPNIETQEAGMSPAGDVDGGGDGDSESQTSSSMTRWWATNDVLAGLLVLGHLAVLVAAGLGLLSPDVLGTRYAQALVVFAGVAVAWAFGKDAVEAWRGGGE